MSLFQMAVLTFDTVVLCVCVVGAVRQMRQTTRYRKSDMEYYGKLVYKTRNFPDWLENQQYARKYLPWWRRTLAKCRNRW